MPFSDVSTWLNAIAICAMMWYFVINRTWMASGTVVLCDLASVGVDAWQHDIPGVAGDMIAVITWGIILFLDWKNRNNRKRRKVLKMIGDKGRAALRKLAENMPSPSPVPVPVRS